jgi:hypothetical protein
VGDAIARASRGCVFATNDDVVAAPDAAQLLVDGQIVPRDPTRTEGWAYVATDAKHIQVFGAACEQLRANEAAEITLQSGCAP